MSKVTLEGFQEDGKKPEKRGKNGQNGAAGGECLTLMAMLGFKNGTKLGNLRKLKKQKW